MAGCSPGVFCADGCDTCVLALPIAVGHTPVICQVSGCSAAAACAVLTAFDSRFGVQCCESCYSAYGERFRAVMRNGGGRWQALDAAALEGYGPVGQLRRITLPVLAPVLVLLAVRDVILTLQVNFVPAYLLTDGGPGNATRYLPVYVYDQAFEFSGFGYAALLTIALMVLTAVLITTMGLLARRWGLLR